MASPRDLFDKPGQFGRVTGAALRRLPAVMDPETAGLVAAAVWQHKFVIALRQHMDAAVLTQRQVADLAGLTESVLSGLMLGKHYATNLNLMRITVTLDAIDLLPSPAGTSDLLNP